MKITNGDSILEVSAKAYEVIYKEHDFTIQADAEQKKQAEPIKPKAPAKKAKAKAGGK